MNSINLDSIMKKVEAYGRSVSGKLRMQEVIQKYAKDGVAKTGTGDKVVTEKDMWLAASKMITVLRDTAKSYDLPSSIMRHFDSLECSRIYQMPDGTSEIYIYFGDDLHRDSLYSDGYDGVDNIIAVLNNGYHAKDYVYGYWDNHAPTGEASSDYRNWGNFLEGRSAYTYIRSMKDREGLHFIQQAVQDFNGNYGSDYNVTAIAGDDYINN